MASIVTTLETEPTGPYVASLPTLLHGVGVTGYQHRWVAGQIAGNAGDNVDSWKDWRGQNPMSKSGQPVLVDNGGVRAVSFDGTDDALTIAALTATQRTLAVVLKVLAADGVNTGILSGTSSGGNPALVRTGSNTVGFFTPSGSAATQGSPGRDAIKAWSIAFLRLDSGNAKARINAGGTDITPSATNGNGFSALRLGHGGSAYGNVAIAEVIGWPTVLTDSQLVTIQATLKQRYSALP